MVRYKLPSVAEGLDIGVFGLIDRSVVCNVRRNLSVGLKYYSILYPFFLRAKYRGLRALNSCFRLGCPIVYFNKNVGYINDLGRNRTQIKINTRTGDVIRYRQDGRLKGIRGERWELDLKRLVKMGLIFDKTEIKLVKYSFRAIEINPLKLVEIDSYLIRCYGFDNRTHFSRATNRDGWKVNMTVQNQINVNESEGFKWLVIGSKFKLYKLTNDLILIKCFNFGLYYNDLGFYAVQDLYGQIYNVSDKDRKLLNDWIKIFRNGINIE